VLAIGLALAASAAYGVSDFLGGLKTRSLALLAVLLVSQGAGSSRSRSSRSRAPRDRRPRAFSSSRCWPD